MEGHIAVGRLTGSSINNQQPYPNPPPPPKFPPTKKLHRLGIEYLKQPTTILEDDTWTRMRQACVGLYKDLLLLEHFAVRFGCGGCLFRDGLQQGSDLPTAARPC